MGEVYRARDTQLDREVAIKVLPAGALADETARKRFRKEAHALSRLAHPHLGTQLSELDAQSYAPLRWSPDGTRIAFSVFDEAGGNRNRIYLAAPGSGGAEPLAPTDPTYFQIDPCWSPDGS